MAAENARESRRLSGWASRLVLVFAVSVACLFLAELAVRWLIPQPLPQPTPGIYRPDPDIGWRRNENIRVVANTGERNVEICTDPSGDRVDCARAEHDCAARVLVLGDSFVEALAIPWSETIWSRLERETGACMQVAGVGGYDPVQYAVQARERLGQGVPIDLVILNFYSGNDFVAAADAIQPSEAVTAPELRLLPTGFRSVDLWNWFLGLNDWLAARSHLYVATRYAVRREIDPEGVERYGIPIALLRSRLTDELLDETARAISFSGAAAQKAGTPLLVVVIPVKNQVLDPRGERLSAAFARVRDEIDMDQVSKRFVPRIAGLPGVTRVVDLLEPLRAAAGPDAWGSRDPHFSPVGHALWYEGIESAVRELLAPHQRQRS